MSFVRPRVDGDSLRSETFAVKRRLEHVGHIPATCVAQEGYFVDVDRESCHIQFGFKVAKVLISDKLL